MSVSIDEPWAHDCISAINDDCPVYFRKAGTNSLDKLPIDQYVAIVLYPYLGIHRHDRRIAYEMLG